MKEAAVAELRIHLRRRIGANALCGRRNVPDSRMRGNVTDVTCRRCLLQEERLAVARLGWVRKRLRDLGEEAVDEGELERVRRSLGIDDEEPT